MIKKLSQAVASLGTLNVNAASIRPHPRTCRLSHGVICQEGLNARHRQRQHLNRLAVVAACMQHTQTGRWAGSGKEPRTATILPCLAEAGGEGGAGGSGRRGPGRRNKRQQAWSRAVASAFCLGRCSHHTTATRNTGQQAKSGGPHARPPPPALAAMLSSTSAANMVCLLPLMPMAATMRRGGGQLVAVHALRR